MIPRKEMISYILKYSSKYTENELCVMSDISLTRIHSKTKVQNMKKQLNAKF